MFDPLLDYQLEKAESAGQTECLSESEYSSASESSVLVWAACYLRCWGHHNAQCWAFLHVSHTRPVKTFFKALLALLVLDLYSLMFLPASHAGSGQYASSCSVFANLHCAAARFASVFQMLRGTLVVFAGFLTIVLLKRRLHIHHWLGIVLISAGAAIVGASRWVTLQDTIYSVERWLPFQGFCLSLPLALFSAWQLNFVPALGADGCVS